MLPSSNLFTADSLPFSDDKKGLKILTPEDGEADAEEDGGQEVLGNHLVNEHGLWSSSYKTYSCVTQTNSPVYPMFVER
jgi:hypothetical protein